MYRREEWVLEQLGCQDKRVEWPVRPVFPDYPFFVTMGILVAGEVEEKKELKNLLMWGKFSFHVMVDREIFTYVENKKQLIVIVNKKFKIVNRAVWSH